MNFVASKTEGDVGKLVCQMFKNVQITIKIDIPQVKIYTIKLINYKFSLKPIQYFRIV